MREYLLVATVAAVVTYLVAVLAREAALRINAVAAVRDRDVHAIPIPYFGGIAMLAGLLAAYLVARNLPFLSTSNEVVFDDAGAVLLGGLIICAVGVVDDIFELDALTKFAGQVAAATVVVALGVQFYYLPLPGGGALTLDPVQAQLLSVFLVVLTVNAVNFVDGLDGLAAGVIGIGSGAYFIYAYILAAENGVTQAIAAALLTAALGVACLGFLAHNFFPARMFMGDSGSMLIGLVLSCSAISLLAQFQSGALTEGVAGARAGLVAPAFLPLILPVAMLLVPFVDLLLAVVRRTRAGRSPFSPDKLHLHHRLLEIGHSHRRAVLAMYMLAALVAFGSVVVSLFEGWRSLILVGVLAVVTLGATFVLPRWRPTMMH
ncbi:MAG: undecaprenyl/decaprenyl-phosphate alpha-N-acetylglucosaminyl 1-phosphate transferase [Nocardioidaceae bacterium]|nr:undecaprenyl/decaprenyl-phosphate alpha-N-acetylglucosaminyl 1-phosphate transferase [Nocardioidaceae bacterium]